jgi:YHS domain-containing protein
MSKDPVCDMMVDEKNAAATTEYKGATYYFCSTGCKVSFEADPGKYFANHDGGSEEHPGRH